MFNLETTNKCSIMNIIVIQKMTAVTPFFRKLING